MKNETLTKVLTTSTSYGLPIQDAVRQAFPKRIANLAMPDMKKIFASSMTTLSARRVVEAMHAKDALLVITAGDKKVREALYTYTALLQSSRRPKAFDHQVMVVRRSTISYKRFQDMVDAEILIVDLDLHDEGWDVHTEQKLQRLMKARSDRGILTIVSTEHPIAHPHSPYCVEAVVPSDAYRTSRYVAQLKKEVVPC